MLCTHSFVSVYKFHRHSLTDSHFSFSFVAPTQALDEVHHAGFIPAHGCTIHSGGAVYLIQFSKPHMSLSIIPVMAGPSPVRHLPHTVTVAAQAEAKVRKLCNNKSTCVLASSESSLLQRKRPLPLETEGQAGIFS